MERIENPLSEDRETIKKIIEQNDLLVKMNARLVSVILNPMWIIPDDGE